ncbi:MAG: YlxR family protein [Symbiobacterium sp.]|uniref:RNase P modulator RnpM n=1 Tax=Symbiobacterium sp. TaxID=1971213 RepID=UPI0034643D57
MARGQQPRVKKVPQRMCVGCGQMRPKKELIRIVRTPDGVIDLDTSPSGKRPGRGAYLCPDRECLAKAIKGKRLERALEQPVSDEIWARLEAGLGMVKPG